MIRLGAATFLLSAALAQAGHANTLWEESRLEINPTPGQSFEVIRQRKMGAAEFWCAAASYVEVRRGLPITTPIYLERAMAPSLTVPGKRAVTFTLDASGLPAPDPARTTLTIDEIGEMMKSAQARRFCRDAFTRSTK